jgi:hypothetical protein
MSATGQISGRNITIAARDSFGNPMPEALIEIFVLGRLIGKIATGSGVAESSVSLGSLTGAVRVRVTAGGSPPQEVDVAPTADRVEIDLGPAPLVKAKIPPVPTCPDGTTGYPCVICHDGNESWQICT